VDRTEELFALPVKPICSSAPKEKNRGNEGNFSKKAAADAEKRP
jgi:hypothetical protein